MYETLKVEREGALAWLTLDRPQRLNAMSRQLVTELRDFFARSPRGPRDARRRAARRRARVLCRARSQGEPERGSRRRRRASRRACAPNVASAELVLLMRRAPQPIIACVQGAASGGGFALALGADVRLAGESARMNAAFIRIGLSACDVGVSYFLPRMVGASIAAELLLTGNFIDAARAERIGLVSRVVPDADLEATARALADDMLRNSPLGAAPDQGVPQREPRRRQPRAGHRHGGPQPDPVHPERGLPRGRARVPREATRPLSRSLRSAPATALRPAPLRQLRRLMTIRTDLYVGVLLPSATLPSGTSGFASG